MKMFFWLKDFLHKKKNVFSTKTLNEYDWEILADLGLATRQSISEEKFQEHDLSKYYMAHYGFLNDFSRKWY